MILAKRYNRIAGPARRAQNQVKSKKEKVKIIPCLLV